MSTTTGWTPARVHMTPQGYVFTWIHGSFSVKEADEEFLVLAERESAEDDSFGLALLEVELTNARPHDHELLVSERQEVKKVLLSPECYDCGAPSEVLTLAPLLSRGAPEDERVVEPACEEHLQEVRLDAFDLSLALGVEVVWSQTNLAAQWQVRHEANMALLGASAQVTGEAVLARLDDPDELRSWKLSLLTSKEALMGALEEIRCVEPSQAHQRSEALTELFSLVEPSDKALVKAIFERAALPGSTGAVLARVL